KMHGITSHENNFRRTGPHMVLNDTRGFLADNMLLEHPSKDPFVLRGWTRFSLSNFRLGNMKDRTSLVDAVINSKSSIIIGQGFAVTKSADHLRGLGLVRGGDISDAEANKLLHFTGPIVDNEGVDMVSGIGSNANGWYVRHANGTLECWASPVGDSSGTVTWTYPAKFVSTPNVTAVPRSSDERIVTISKSLESCSFHVCRTTGAPSDRGVEVRAIGRWR